MKVSKEFPQLVPYLWLIGSSKVEIGLFGDKSITKDADDPRLKNIKKSCAVFFYVTKNNSDNTDSEENWTFLNEKSYPHIQI